MICLIPVQEKGISVNPEQFAQNWVVAYSSNDHKKLSGFYEASEKLEVRMSSGIKVVGIKKLKEIFKSEFDQADFIYSKAKNISTRELGQTAIVSFEHVFGFKTANKEAFEGHVQTVLVLHKSKEAWQIVSEHSSTIKDIPRLKPIKY